MNEDRQESATKRITSHAVGVVLWKMEGLGKTGELCIAAFCYDKWHRTTLRLPMETQGLHKRRPETLTQTAFRGLRAEVLGLEPPPISLFWFPRRILYWETVQDDTHPDELHLKVFLAAGLESGKFREHRLIEGEGTDGEEILEPPSWHEVRGLLLEMSQPSRSLLVHRKAVVATFHALAIEHPSVALRYTVELQNSAGFAAVDTTHRAEMERYVTKLEADQKAAGIV